jgi:SAM-dependent methyltransferase
MNRERSNRIRFVIEEVLPPMVRDSRLFGMIAATVFGDYIWRAAEFRRRAPFLTEAEYERLYRDTPWVHDSTDNSKACLTQIVQDVVGGSVCDVGCGTGYLLEHLQANLPAGTALTGCDFIAPKTERPGIAFFESKIETLPFPDGAFDTVVCTHVLEHILDLQKALSELRRISRRRLIIIVPQEREGRYTFNPHFHFFPYPESFLRALIRVPEGHVCKLIGRDIYYREDRAPPPGA